MGGELHPGECAGQGTRRCAQVGPWPRCPWMHDHSIGGGCCYRVGEVEARGWDHTGGEPDDMARRPEIIKEVTCRRENCGGGRRFTSTAPSIRR